VAFCGKNVQNQKTLTFSSPSIHVLKTVGSNLGKSLVSLQKSFPV
jgi:hypothetical protein